MAIFLSRTSTFNTTILGVIVIVFRISCNRRLTRDVTLVTCVTFPFFIPSPDVLESPKFCTSNGIQNTPQMPKDTKTHPNVHRWHHDLHPSLKIHHGTHPIGNSPFFRPTQAHLFHENESKEEGGRFFTWTSRDHRKNRYRMQTPDGQQREVGNVWQKIWNMRRLEYWNVSWWVGITYTVGSIAWAINGFIYFLPSSDNTHFAKDTTSIGWSAFFGAIIFSLGSFFGMWEAWNRSDTAAFGKEVRGAAQGSRNEINNGGRDLTTTADEESQGSGTGKPERWIWFSANKKYWHEIGFIAAFAQFCGANIYAISGFTALPEIQNSIVQNTGLLDGIYWAPQVVGGVGFIISATLAMLETQEKWYVPAPHCIGWHVGFWNCIGAIGFTLCGALGFAAAANSKVEYQCTLSTLWGAWAFLFGSLIQWFEGVNA